MKKGIEKLVLAALCFTVAGGAAFAAGGSQGGAASSGPMEILWAGNISPAALPVPDGIMVKDIEERFNVKLTMFPTGYNANQQQFNLLIASGQVPDYWNDYNHWAWYNQGVLKTVTLDQITQNMPTYYKTRIQAYDPDEISLRSRLDPNGGGYIGVPVVGFYPPLLRAYRQDWLDNLGLKVPETLEEMDRVVRAFTFNDPDKNGKNDTWGLNVHPGSSFHQDMGDVYGAFGVRVNYWQLENGKIIYSAAMNGFKEALKVMRQWYKDGVIYPEFLTQSAETGNALLLEGQVGTLFLSSIPYLAADFPGNSTARDLLERNPKAVLGVAINGLKGPDGKNFTYTWGFDLGWTMHFSYKASDEKIAKIMQINDFYLEGEGWLLQQFGKEGVSFDYVNGMPVSRLSATEQGKQGIGNLVINNPTAAAMELLYKGTQYFDVTVASLRLEMSQNAIGRMPLTESNNAGIGGDIQQIINKYAADVVTGAVDIDATWNSYLADLDRAGLAMQTVEAQKIYDTYFK